MVDNQIPENARKIVYKMYGGRCAYCGHSIKPDEMQIDHLTLCNDADDALENMLPVCPLCGTYKGKMSIEEFREELSKLPQLLEEIIFYKLARSYDLVEDGWSPRKVTFWFESHSEQREEILTRVDKNREQHYIKAGKDLMVKIKS